MLLLGRSRMASTLSHPQFIPIALAWADLELAQELVTTHNLFGTLFHSLVPSTLLRVHILLDMMVMNLYLSNALWINLFWLRGEGGESTSDSMANSPCRPNRLLYFARNLATAL